MPRDFSHGHLRDEDLPASPGLSRVLILGFLVAGLLGFVIGLGWVGWHLLFVTPAA